MADFRQPQTPVRDHVVVQHTDASAALGGKSGSFLARAQRLLVVPRAVSPGEPFFILDGCFTHVCHRFAVERQRAHVNAAL